MVIREAWRSVLMYRSATLAQSISKEVSKNTGKYLGILAELSRNMTKYHK